MLSWLATATVLLLVSHVALARNAKLSTELRNARITPNIVPTEPEDIATIEYVNDVCTGEVLNESEVYYRPRITYKTRPAESYTLLLIDPDFPSVVAPNLRSALHWMVVNIPGNNITAGTPVAIYVPAVSYPGSGCHRFILLVYAQMGTFNTTDQSLSQYGVNRFRFSLTNFVTQYGLGDLVAANFFRTCAVPIRDENYCKA